MSDPINIPAYRLKQGAMRPYGGSGAPVDRAHLAALGIMADLLDRGGIKDVLARIDQDVKPEIVSDIAAIIREAVQPGSEPPIVATAKTLRDEFAMAALTGFIGNSECAQNGMEPMLSYLARDENAEWLAGRVYVIADAMMKVRGQ